MNYAALLSFLCGFISLSLEILWVRLYGFSMMSTPMAFGFILMAYLSGIAIGAWHGGKICNEQATHDKLWRRSVIALGVSAGLTLASPWIFAWAQNQWWRHPIFDFVLIACVSASLAYVFPIAHHLGTNSKGTEQGRRFASVYTANVLGSALGPLVTGYLLLNVFSLQQAFVLMAALQLVIAGGFYWRQSVGRYPSLSLAGAAALAVLVLLISQQTTPHALIAQLTSNRQIPKRTIENKHGIITVFEADSRKHLLGDDAIYGGNVYDGRTNLSMEANTNGLDRPLLLAALQPEPKKTLMVGLSIGSWLALVNAFPGLEHIDVIEINSGYIDAMQDYPKQAQALQDPRANLIITDARRWLRLNPDERYDLIIMNTTYHWRANAGFLLSKEYLQLIQKHMKPGAVMAFNATNSPDAFYTATQVFPYAYRYGNFIYAADFDFRSRKNEPAAYARYASMQLQGESLFEPGSDKIDQYLNRRFHTVVEEERITGRPLELITDKNAITEYKYGSSLKRQY